MKYVIAILLFLPVLGGCDKKINYQAEGTLTGVDMALCPCCGGVVLTIDNNSGQYRVDSIRFMSQQDLYNLDFPVRIKFNYVNKGSCTVIRHLIITDYVLLK